MIPYRSIHTSLVPRNQVPIYGLGQANRLDIREAVVSLLVRAGELLLGNAFQARHQIEAKKMTKGKPHDALSMGVNELAVDIQLRAMVQHTFDHRRNF